MDVREPVQRGALAVVRVRPGTAVARGLRGLPFSCRSPR